MKDLKKRIKGNDRMELLERRQVEKDLKEKEDEEKKDKDLEGREKTQEAEEAEHRRLFAARGPVGKGSEDWERWMKGEKDKKERER